MKYFKPGTALRIINTLQKRLAIVCILMFVMGLYYSLFHSPADYIQGENVRIMYVHVPAAWGGLFGYTVMAVCSVIGLIWGSPFWHLVTKSVAPIGACLTAISLVTGSLWGKPTWGTWWVWDARLTTMLLLFFLYCAYGFITTQIPSREKAAKAGAYIAIVGWINVPLIKWSVTWWHTLHQPASIIGLTQSKIHPDMLHPLLLMAGAFFLWGACLAMMRLKAELLRLKEASPQRKLVQAEIITKEAA